jgi:cell division control protein 6
LQLKLFIYAFPVELTKKNYLDKEELKKIVSEVEKENSLFISKFQLDTLTFPSTIIGRKEQVKELVSFLATYKQGLVVPFIAVYGRSGSGKSTIVKFVCENLDGISHCFVNLRKARTVFGCANLILAELGEPNLKSAQGINLAIEKIQAAILSTLKKTGNKLFVLALDEFDVLFYDRRGRPSDFIYKLLVMEEKLREQGYLVSIIAISNNIMSDYEIDDRVRSRIGSSEIFFSAYSKQDVLQILKDKAERAIDATAIEPGVLEYCADSSSQEHGDARRAIDLLRVAAEIAGKKGEKISKAHVDSASEQLQKDRINLVLSTASYQLKLVCFALARITFLTDEEWHSTSTLYKQYHKIVGNDVKPLTYRRVSELLMELENTGLAVSLTSSKGRHGYGTQYKLTVSPEIAGKICFPKGWKNLVEIKAEHDSEEQQRKIQKASSRNSIHRKYMFSGLRVMLDQKTKNDWDNFVGL